MGHLAERLPLLRPEMPSLRIHGDVPFVQSDFHRDVST
jgi:hypothetical protein